MRERRTEDREPVPAPARRAGQIDDQSRAAQPGHAAREERVRRTAERVRAYRLGNALRLAIEHASGRLGRDVARCEPRPARGQHESRSRCELAQRLLDLSVVVRDDATSHVESLVGEQLRQRVAARILASPVVHAVRDRQHCGIHDGSFVFSARCTPSTDIPESIAFAMS